MQQRLYHFLNNDVHAGRQRVETNSETGNPIKSGPLALKRAAL